MALVKATQWANQKFERGSRPGREKIAAWIQSGQVPGVILDGVAYVDAERFDLLATCPKQNNTGTLHGIDLLT